MDIALIGYGKMGKIIESVALSKGHRIILKIDIDNQNEFTRENLQKAQVAIEFTSPNTAFQNVTRCLEFDTPVISGSTGWHHRLDEVKKLCLKRNGSIMCASNFSIGVNVFFALNRYLAKIMNRVTDYQVNVEETHHVAKLDAPSGTAITLAEGIIEEIGRLKKWELGDNGSSDILPIKTIRKDDVPGTHCVKYTSTIDDIEIIHTAHNRQGFALGAVLAAEFIHDKKGIFSMNDLLQLNF